MSEALVEYLDGKQEVVTTDYSHWMQAIREGVWEGKQLRSITLCREGQPFEKDRILFIPE